MRIGTDFPAYTLALWLLLMLIHSGAASGAVATPGPWIEQSWAAPASVDVKPRDQGPDQTVRHRSKAFQATMLAPIPARFVGGLLIPRVELTVAQTVVDGAETPPWLKNRQVVPVGAVWLPHVAEGSPRWFLMAMRHGSFATRNTAAPMTEGIVGGDLEQTWPRFHHTDISRTRLLLRWRRFPHGERWLPVLEHHVARANGTFVTVGIPTGLTGGWQTADLSTVWTGGVKTSSRAFPIGAPALGRTWEHPRVDLWAEGYTLTIFAGLRQRLDGILFWSTEIGAQQEVTTLYTEGGNKLSTSQSQFAPWIRLGLETWVDRT